MIRRGFEARVTSVPESSLTVSGKSANEDTAHEKRHNVRKNEALFRECPGPRCDLLQVTGAGVPALEAAPCPVAPTSPGLPGSLFRSAFPGPAGRQWLSLERSSPVTVARPRRILTAFRSGLSATVAPSSRGCQGERGDVRDAGVAWGAGVRPLRPRKTSRFTFRGSIFESLTWDE